MKKFEKKTVYIYEINGQEKVTITSPEEASRWDAIFEAAERIDTWMQDNPPELKMDEAQRTDLCLYLAQHKDALISALGSDTAESSSANQAEDSSSDSDKKDEEKPAEPEEKSSGMKKQSFVQEFKRPVPPSKDGFSL
ncbi:YebG family protein [Motiliproteus sediminis]|uniref:YebG family protein n=1 Tax=Motiliproteus sediminis TaxID=1468178 RepID=UPI001AEFF1C7|nr:YebG family protein [Motiliproteus sediminis]